MLPIEPVVQDTLKFANGTELHGSREKRGRDPGTAVNYEDAMVLFSIAEEKKVKKSPDGEFKCKRRKTVPTFALLG